MKTRWDPTCRFIRTSGAIHLTGRPAEVLFNSSTEAYNECERPKSDTFATVPFWARRMFLRSDWINSCILFVLSVTWQQDHRALSCAARGTPSRDSPAHKSLNMNFICLCPFKRHGYCQLTYSQAININKDFFVVVHFRKLWPDSYISQEFCCSMAQTQTGSENTSVWRPFIGILLFCSLAC